MQNPFTLTFGRSPLESVDRPVQINEIIENFTADTINQQMFIITGVRGSGKTVMMTEISHKLRENDDWVVIELNPATDLLSAMLSKLNSDNICAGLIKSAKLDLSFFGFGVSIEGTQPITDAETAIIKILEVGTIENMTIKDIEFKLKDGRTAILRSAYEKDAKALIEYMKKSTGETDFLLRTPEECETRTIEQEIDFINSCNLSDTHTLLVCEADGKIAGNCMVWWNKRAKTGHRANVAIGLLSEFWNQGIGTRMFREMIKIAESNPNILQMELDFIEGNSRARALYEKMGFRITGIKFNSIRQNDGTLCNEYSMIREISR